MLQQGSIAFFGGLELLEEVGEQRHVKAIDLRHFRDLLGIIAVMREWMMRIGNTDFGVRAVAGLSSELKGDHSSDVALHGQQLQVEH